MNRNMVLPLWCQCEILTVWSSAGCLSAAAGLKAWVSEGRTGAGRFLHNSSSSSSCSSCRGQRYSVQRSTSSLTPPPWTLHLLRNWKIHKWVDGGTLIRFESFQSWRGSRAFRREAPAHSGMLGCTAGGKTGFLVQSPVDDGCQSFFLFLFLIGWTTDRVENLFSSPIGHPPPGVSEGRAGWLAPVCLSLLVVAVVINISVCAC